MLLLTLSLLLQADTDQVKLKTGEVVAGRLIEMTDAVIVEVDGAAPREIKRAQIETIVYARDFIRFPTIAEFQHPAIRDRTPVVEAAAGRVILTTDRADAPLIVMDPAGRRPPLELAMEGRLRWRAIDGKYLYLMSRTARTDEGQKFMAGGFEEFKTVHTLTFHAVDLIELKEAWTRVFDNNDRDDLYWSFMPAEPAVLIRADGILLIADKQGNPVDKKTRQLDPSNTRRFATTYEFSKDPLKDRVQSADAEDLLGIPALAEEKNLLVWQDASVRRPRVVVYDTKKKKVVHERLETPPERLLGVVGGVAYLSGENYVTAVELKRFTVAKGFPIGIGRGTVERIDGGAIVVRRDDLATPALAFYDLQRGKEISLLRYTKAEDPVWCGRAGKYVLFADKKPSVFAYDTLENKPAWRVTQFSGAGTPGVAIIGNTVYTLLHDRLSAIDLHAGDRHWEVKAPNFGSIQATGGVLAGSFFATVRMVREHPLPDGARIPSATGVPPIIAMGRGGFAAPYEHDGALWSVDAGGKLIRFDFEAKSWDEGTTAVESPIGYPASVAGATAVFDGLTNHVLFDVEKRETIAAYPRYTQNWPEPVSIAGDVLYLRSQTDVLAYDLKARKELWKRTLPGPNCHPVRAGDRLLALQAKSLTVLDPATGKPGDSFDLRVNNEYRSVHVDAKGRVFLMDSAVKLARRTESLKKDKWLFEPKIENAPEARKLPGHLVMTGDRLLYLHGGNELVGLDPESGETMWTLAVPQRTSPLLLHGDVVYFSDFAAGLRALKVADGTDASPPIAVADAANYWPFVWKGEVWFWSTDGYAVPAK